MLSLKPLPIFMPQDDGLLAFSNQANGIGYESQNENMPADKRAALDAFEEIAERPEHKFSFKLQPGDLLLTTTLLACTNAHRLLATLILISRD